jgi:hypothetical protein
MNVLQVDYTWVFRPLYHLQHIINILIANSGVIGHFRKGNMSRSPKLRTSSHLTALVVLTFKLIVLHSSMEVRTYSQFSPNTLFVRSLMCSGVDPWLDLCYHSTEAPLRTSSDNNPEYLIAGAGHHWDSYGILDIDAEPLFIQQAHIWEIKTVKKWLRTFKDWKPHRTNVTAAGK